MLVRYANTQTVTAPIPVAHEHPTPRLILAPMEGVVDAVMRDLLTGIGGYDRCVTEFIRVSQTVLPARVFYRRCPELSAGGKTPSGIPVYIQLLGSHPDLLARNAQVAYRLGAPGIDLNFGCPAKTVNKSQGGASLLKNPPLIYEICSAVRSALPRTVPLTAKIRLGFEDDQAFEAVVAAVVNAGVDELTVHARTRRQGYRPPAHWQRLADVSRHIGIPMIANGELWSPSDVIRCASVSGCHHFMLARGALCRPDLGLATRALLTNTSHDSMLWEHVHPFLQAFLERNALRYEAHHALNPLKQWLVYLAHYFPQAAALFAQVKRIRQFDDMLAALR